MCQLVRAADIRSSATVRPPRRSHEDERSGKPFEGGSTMKASQIFLLAGTSLAAATPALAQDAAADGVVADGDMIVTAQRRAESINDVGMAIQARSEEHTSELQSLMRISYAVFCLQKK